MKQCNYSDYRITRFSIPAPVTIRAVAYRDVTTDRIILNVARYSQISVSDITGQNRSRVFSEPRIIAMYFIKKYLPRMTFKAIGAAFGGRDHSTAMYSLTTAADLMETNKEFKEKMLFFEQLFDDKFIDAEQKSVQSVCELV